MPELHLRQRCFNYNACGPFTKDKERMKYLKKQEIQEKIIKRHWIRLAFNMIRLKEILRICLGKQFVIKYYMVKHLVLLKFRKNDGYQTSLASNIYKFFVKKSSAMPAKNVMELILWVMLLHVHGKGP